MERIKQRQQEYQKKINHIQQVFSSVPDISG